MSNYCFLVCVHQSAPDLKSRSRHGSQQSKSEHLPTLIPLRNIHTWSGPHARSLVQGLRSSHVVVQFDRSPNLMPAQPNTNIAENTIVNFTYLSRVNSTISFCNDFYITFSKFMTFNVVKLFKLR